MKKTYEKPVAEVVEFNLQENLMDTGGAIEDVPGEVTTSVEEW